MSLVRSKLWVDAGVVVDGLDGELLLALIKLHVSDTVDCLCCMFKRHGSITYLLLLLVVARVHNDILGNECSFGIWFYCIACRKT